MSEATGFKVVDLEIDVKVDVFVKKALEIRPQIV
jgi:methanogenic corrinoid protein MtbC1